MPRFDLNSANRNKNKQAALTRQNNVMRLVGVAFLLAVLLVIFITTWIILDWFQDPKRLPISKLVIIGERNYTRDDDIRQSILALGAPRTFMTQDVNIIKKQLERFSWIKQIGVRKQWPNKLKIYLLEYVPVARWNDQYMVDIDGNFFKTPCDRIKENILPKLYSPEGNERAVFQGFRIIEQVLAERHFTLQEVTMTARRSWNITLTNGITLHLGRGNTIKKLSRFLELYPILKEKEQHDGRQISYVDLRYELGAAVGWEPTSSKISSFSHQ